MFLLSILMSSQIIYNTTGFIDQKSVEDLGKMCLLENLYSSNGSKALPSLVWVIRNFTLGHQFTSDKEYLENSLAIKTDDSKSQIENKESISKWFTEERRKCICLPVPASDLPEMKTEEILSKLSEVHPSKLRPEFNTLMNVLIKLSRENVKPSGFNEGKSFVEFLEHLVELLNTNSIISEDDLTKTALDIKKKIFERSLDSKIREKLNGVPIEITELDKIIHQALESESKKIGVDESNLEFKKISEKISKRFHEVNNKRMADRNRTILIEQWNGIKNRLVSEQNKMISAQEFEKAVNDSKSSYYKLAYGDDIKDKIYKEFIQTIDFEVIKNCIINSSPLPSNDFETKYTMGKLEKELLKYRLADTK